MIGITGLNFSNYYRDLCSDIGEAKLDLLFQPLCSFYVAAAEPPEDPVKHSELGGLFSSMSSNLDEFRFGLYYCLTDAGFINIMNGVCFLQNLRRICIPHINARWIH